MDDARTRPFQDLAPVDVRLMVESGIPESLIVDGKLDIEGVLALGWTIDNDGTLRDPDVEIDDIDDDGE